MPCSSKMMRCSVICLLERSHQSRFSMIQTSINDIVLVTIVQSERNMQRTELFRSSRRLIKHPLSLRHAWRRDQCAHASRNAEQAMPQAQRMLDEIGRAHV